MTRPTRVILLASLAVLLAVAGFVFTRNLIDFPVYYAAGRSLLDGRTDLYAPDYALGPVMDYRYPPFFLVAFAPLWLLSYPAAAYLWYLIGVALVCISCYALNRLLADIESSAAAGGIARAWAVTFFAVAQYYVMILHYGNAHLVAVSLMLISLCLVPRGKETLGAFFFAVALTIKITPALILPFFAIKRRWRFVAVTTAFVILLNLLPAAWLGFGKNLELLGAWFDHVVVSQEFHEINGPINLSLKGQLRRYLTRVGYESRVDGDVDYRQVSVAHLTPGRADLLWIIAGVALYVLVLSLVWRRSGRRRSGERTDYALDIGLMISLTLIAGPLSSKIYFVALLWPVLVLATVKWNNGWIRRGLLFIAAMNVVLPLLPGRSIQRLLLVVGIDFYLAFLVLTLCAYAGSSSVSRAMSCAGHSRSDIRG